MPYPTGSCVVIELVVPFMVFLFQLEPFDYSKINNDQQRVAYELLFKESSYREIPTPTINHDCTVKIDGVVKSSVKKINGIGDNMEKDKFSIKIFKQDKGVDLFFKEVTTLVPLYWTPKLYAIFLCELALRQKIWLCIYLDVTHDNSIESINGINVLYEENISKSTYDTKISLACSFVKSGSI